MLPALRNRKLSNISVGRKYQLTDKEVNIMSEIRRGDIWMVDFGVPEDENDHKLHGIRPVVIVSNDSANRHSTVFHAVPLTSKIHKKTYLPTHIFISSFKAVGLRTNSIAQCEQLCDVKDTDLIEKIGKVSKNQLRQITKGMQIQLGIEKSTKKRKKNLFICPYCGRKLMNSSAVCTPKLLCPKRRMVRTGECQQIFMLKSEAQDKVLEITKEICRTLIQEEELKRASKDKRKVTSDEYLISELKAEYDRISNSTVSCYQSYREGKYTKEEYVQLRKTNQELLADLENQISDLQEKAANQEPDTEEKIEQLTQYSMLEQYDGDVLSNIIDKVLIYNDKDIEVVFKGENFIRNAV